MIVETLLDKAPPWCKADAPDASLVLWSQCSAVRNLSDYPFPRRCSPEEKRSVEQRILEALESASLLASGRYYSLDSLDPQEARFLAERHLITYSVLCGSGARGVYVSEDQCLSIMVNGVDHLCMRVLLGGQQLEEAWHRLSLADDLMSSVLDFAYSDRLGYLTSSLERVGTGLKAGMLLHLPALTQTHVIETKKRQTKEQSRVTLGGVHVGAEAVNVQPAHRGAARQAPAGLDQGLYGELGGVFQWGAKARGDLYLLTNEGALGLSEEEFLFRLRHVSKDLLDAERRMREAMITEGKAALEDRVGRALGLAGPRGAWMAVFHPARGGPGSGAASRHQRDQRGHAPVSRCASGSAGRARLRSARGEYCPRRAAPRTLRVSSRRFNGLRCGRKVGDRFLVNTPVLGVQ
jgi:protein arginine kinase